METIERGTVKYLRVVESPEKRFWTNAAWNGGTGTQAPGMAWDDFNNKRILGTVPVEPDGSAYFAVPADTFVYLPAARRTKDDGPVDAERHDRAARRDDRLRRLPREPPDHRTGQPLATRPGNAPPAIAALVRTTPHVFSYRAEVQPVFDQHCVSCHDYGKRRGRSSTWPATWGSCSTRRTSSCGARATSTWSAPARSPVQPPGSWGSHASRLAQVLLEGHGDPEIDTQRATERGSFDRIVTWIDINAPYYPEYAGGAFREHPFGRASDYDRAA